MQASERTAFEKQLAYEFASRLPPQAHQDWAACRHTSRAIVQFDSIFVLWQQFMSEPMIVGSLRVIDVSASFKEGLKLHIEYQDSTIKGRAWVGHAPTDVLGNGRFFAHVPFKPEVTYHTRTDNAPYSLRLPVVFRTQGNPNDLVEGELQVSQVGAFRATYPQFKEIRL